MRVWHVWHVWHEVKCIENSDGSVWHECDMSVTWWFCDLQVLTICAIMYIWRQILWDLYEYVPG